MPADYRKVKPLPGTMHFRGLGNDQCKVRWELTPVVWDERRRRAMPQKPKPIDSAEAAKLIGYWKKNSTRFRRANPDPSTLMMMKRRACKYGSEEIETPQGYLTAWRERGR